MTLLVTRDGIKGDIAFNIARLENLLDDLQQLGDGNLPSPRNIIDAPVIDCWAPYARSAGCLMGQVTGHPYLSGSLSVTSDLWVFAPELGWARTLSRFYRLGRPRDGEWQP